MSSADAGSSQRQDKLSRVLVAGAMLAFTSLTAWLGLARYAAVHNRTFDLALYARMAWGLAHAQAWDPIVGGSFLGGHLAIVLLPLGLLGRLFGTVPVLLVAQSLAVALAAWPVSQLAARRFGPTGAVMAACSWLLYPNLGHVTTYEFHPGTLALWPLCAALDAFDRERPRALVWLCLAVVACRVSFSLQTCVLGLLAMRGAPALRRSGRIIAISSAAYFALWQLLLYPRFGQTAISPAELHFGQWGGNPLGVLPALLRAPATVLEHFSAPQRLGYPLLVLAPFAFLPLLRPRFLLLSLPPLALNLLSQFPTASTLYSHYLTPAVPGLIAAALDGACALAARAPDPKRIRAALISMLLLGSATGSALAGGLPWSRDFSRAEFSYDGATASARSVIALIGPAASVQAPDPLLPHLAERALVCRVPPPERVTDFVVLDITHRQRFAQREDLLRTTEEPLVRNWLARADHGLVFADRQFLVLHRGRAPRAGLTRRYFLGYAPPGSGTALTECLAVQGAQLLGKRLELDLIARGRCPHDLAIRLGADNKPARVDLLFDGLLSPAHLSRGDRLRSTHSLGLAERDAILRVGLHVGALRSSGAPPRPYDPLSVEVPLRVVR